MRLRDGAIVVLLSVSGAPAAGLSVSDASILTDYRGAPAAQTKAAMLEGTSWQLTNLPGLQPADLASLRRPVTLHLVKGRITGFGGCNLLTGTYTTKGSSVTLNLASTLMACPEPGASIERAFLQTLKGPLSHAVKADRLTLTTASGVALEFNRAPTPTLEGHTWNVTGFNNGRQAVVSLIPDTHLTLSFEKGMVTGQAGCNTFHATYTAQANRIKIGAPATTRMACADAVMTQERAFLAALASATRWAIDGGMLDMHRGDDERALTAEPSEAKQK